MCLRCSQRPSFKYSVCLPRRGLERRVLDRRFANWQGPGRVQACARPPRKCLSGMSWAGSCALVVHKDLFFKYSACLPRRGLERRVLDRRSALGYVMHTFQERPCEAGLGRVGLP